MSARTRRAAGRIGRATKPEPTRAEGRALARSLINTVAIYTQDYPGLSDVEAKRKAVAAPLLADPAVALPAIIVVIGRVVRELADVRGLVPDVILDQMRDWADFDLRDEA